MTYLIILTAAALVILLILGVGRLARSRRSLTTPTSPIGTSQIAPTTSPNEGAAGSFKERLDARVHREVSLLTSRDAVDEGTPDVLDDYIDELVAVEHREIERRAQLLTAELASRKARLKSDLGQSENRITHLDSAVAESTDRYRRLTGQHDLRVQELGVLVRQHGRTQGLRLPPRRRLHRMVTEAQLRHRKTDLIAADNEFAHAMRSFHGDPSQEQEPIIDLRDTQQEDIELVQDHSEKERIAR